MVTSAPLGFEPEAQKGGLLSAHRHSSPFLPDGVCPPGDHLLRAWRGAGAGVDGEGRGGRDQPRAQSGGAWREHRVGAGWPCPAV